MRDDMHFVAAPREVTRERKVGHIHPAERGEVAGDDEPGLHLRSLWTIAPCRAPSRNQYCSPTWVANGTKVKNKARVPTLTAVTT
jgi:hypothetical protein